MNFIYLIFTIVISIIISLAAGEGFLRIKNNDMKNYDIEMWRYAKEIKTPSENPILGHEHVASTSAVLQSVNIRINKDGIRGPNLTQDAIGNRRVLFIGGSITLGWGVEEEATLTEQLNQMLKNEFPKTSILNGGIGNYNAERYVERYSSKLQHINPDIVVVQYFINDAEDLKSGGGNWFLRNSQLAVTLWGAYHKFIGNTGESALLEHYQDVYKKDFVGYNKMKAAFEKLSTLSQNNGFDVLLVMTPDIHNLKQYPFNFIHEEIQRLSKQFNFSYVDLLPAFAGKDAKEFWAMPGDPHPNSKGHKLMAEKIFPTLKTMLLKKSK
jgi:lysophospholipase L1-like esterase